MIISILDLVFATLCLAGVGLNAYVFISRQVYSTPWSNIFIYFTLTFLLIMRLTTFIYLFCNDNKAGDLFTEEFLYDIPDTMYSMVTVYLLL